MDPTLKIWLVIVLVGALNFLSRLSFIALFARRSMPAGLARALKYVPAAMLTALVVPMIVGAPPPAVGVQLDARVLAAVIAGVVAFHTRSTLATLVSGMAGLWLLRLLVPGLG
ncbi:MAG: AzlD domain-containing protein [Casimicrobiaceae bacterium]